MSYRTLIGSVDGLAEVGTTVDGLQLAAFAPANFVGLATCYLASYPPEAGPKDLAAAKAKVSATLRGDYGRVLPGASPTALLGGEVVGSLQIVDRPAWDSGLGCPFIIEVFVHPDNREQGVASALLASAASRLKMGGFEQVALRVEDGISAAAMRLFTRAGFADLDLRSAGA